MKAINLKTLSELYRKQEEERDRLHDLRIRKWGVSDVTLEIAQARAADACKAFEAEAEKVLSPVLLEVQGKAHVRTISALDIVSALADVESRLRITKKALNGVSVVIDLNAQDFPSAYKWTPDSTIFWAMFKLGRWFITDIKRDTTRRASQRVVVFHTEASKAALVSRFSSWG